MIKLLHGADFHLDSAFSALSPEQAAARRQEQRLALDQLSRLCRDCDVVLLAGDLFDSAHVYRDTMEALRDFFASVNAEIFIAPGNHDCLCEGSPYLTERWGENVHIFTSSQIERVRLDRLNCDVYGAAFLSPEAPSLLEGFQAEDPARLNLMVLHGDLQKGSVYNAISSQQVASSNLDYLALGHVHSQSIQKFGSVFCAYPGCLMGRGFDECGQKGVLKAELDKGRCETIFVPLDVRKYEILTVEVKDSPLQEILTALPENTAQDCYRILLTGETESLDLDGLYRQLAPRFFSLSLRDHTHPGKDLWAAVGEDTLRGHFLRNLKAQYDAAEEEQQKKLAMAAKLVTALMDGREVPL